MVVFYATGILVSVSSEVCADEPSRRQSAVMVMYVIPKRSGNLRVDLPNTTILCWYAEAHANPTLVTHIRRSTSRPLCLHVACFPPDPVIAPIYQKCNANVDNLGNKHIALLVWSIFLDLREDEGVLALDDMLGQSGHCELPHSALAQSCIPTMDK